MLCDVTAAIHVSCGRTQAQHQRFLLTFGQQSESSYSQKSWGTWTISRHWARYHEWLSNPHNTRRLLISNNHDELNEFPTDSLCLNVGQESIIVTRWSSGRFIGQRLHLQPLHKIDHSLGIQTYVRALAGKVKIRRPDHTSTLNLKHCLADFYRSQRKLDEAGVAQYNEPFRQLGPLKRFMVSLYLMKRKGFSKTSTQRGFLHEHYV